MDAHADAGLSEPVAPATAARAARAAGLCTVALAGLLVAGLSMVLAGLSLVLGERVDRAADAGGGYELTVDYPGRTRGGLTQDIDILIRQAGGFDGPVTVALSTDYLRVFEQQGLLPEPSSATAGPERVEWTFDPPAGDSGSSSTCASNRTATAVRRAGCRCWTAAPSPSRLSWRQR